MSSLKEIEKAALQLSANDRARLAMNLIKTLDEEEDPESEQEWLEEVNRRSEELKQGKVVRTPGKQALENARIGYNQNLYFFALY
jgi:putative addiction module component (TIGR02574 family)